MPGVQGSEPLHHDAASDCEKCSYHPLRVSLVDAIIMKKFSVSTCIEVILSAVDIILYNNILNSNIYIFYKAKHYLEIDLWLEPHLETSPD